MGRRRKKGLCPCGSRQPYLRCCGRFIDGGELPDTPSELMRSRYSAYAFGDVDYIIETTAPDGDAWNDDREGWMEGIRDFHRSCDFRGVEILEAEHDERTGTVTFRARLRRGDSDASFEETSTFHRDESRWLYVSGVPRDR
ncbi:MAG: YchJ family metal-binding protein [Halobacteriales archaeon]|nr:YchJ family metal-binding protein [Halobacteriales archaeon]